MSAGLSGSYGINGTDFTTQPTEHNWLERGAVDYALDGHIVYAGIRQYQFRWNTLSPSDYNQLLGFYNLVSSTGTVVVDLPQYGASDYRFYSYSGCTLQEPYCGGFFNENIKDVTMIVEGIRT